MEEKEYSRLMENAKSIFEFKRTLPYRMNVIRSAARGRLKEIAHSMILADLLHDAFILKDFLKEFLSTCCCDIKEGEFQIKREFKHIDLYLENDSNFVIIENKVNGAVEQDEQIYRYVSEASKTKKRIYVLYLKSIDNTMPSEKTTKDKNGNDVFSLMNRDDFKVLSYLYDILPWLRSIESKIEGNQKGIKTSLYQYIDYLRMKYDLDGDNNLKIMKKIDSLLNIASDLCVGLKIKKYFEHLKLISDYAEQLENCKRAVFENETEKWQKKLKEIWGNKVELRKNTDDDGTGWRFYIAKKIEVIFSTDKGEPFWGIYVPKEESTAPYLKKLQKKYTLEYESEYWTFGCWTTYENIMIDAREIHDTLEKMGLLKSM